MAATVGVFAFSIWPKDGEFDVTPVALKRHANATNKYESTNKNESTNIANNTNPTSLVNENTNTPNNTNVGNTNSIDEVTKGWKTYANTVYSFTIKYPPTYDVSQSGTEFAIAPLDGSYPNPYIAITNSTVENVKAELRPVTTETTIQSGTVYGKRFVYEMEIGGTGLTDVYVHQGRTYELRGIDKEIDKQIFSTLTFTK